MGVHWSPFFFFFWAIAPPLIVSLWMVRCFSVFFEICDFCARAAEKSKVRGGGKCWNLYPDSTPGADWSEAGWVICGFVFPRERIRFRCVWHEIDLNQCLIWDWIYLNDSSSYWFDSAVCLIRAHLIQICVFESRLNWSVFWFKIESICVFAFNLCVWIEIELICISYWDWFDLCVWFEIDSVCVCVCVWLELCVSNWVRALCLIEMRGGANGEVVHLSNYRIKISKYLPLPGEYNWGLVWERSKESSVRSGTRQVCRRAEHYRREVSENSVVSILISFFALRIEHHVWIKQTYDIHHALTYPFWASSLREIRTSSSQVKNYALKQYGEPMRKFWVVSSSQYIKHYAKPLLIWIRKMPLLGVLRKMQFLCVKWTFRPENDPETLAYNIDCVSILTTQLFWSVSTLK